jgi:hypothetical protein
MDFGDTSIFDGVLGHADFGSLLVAPSPVSTLVQGQPQPPFWDYRLVSVMIYNLFNLAHIYKRCF